MKRKIVVCLFLIMTKAAAGQDRIYFDDQCLNRNSVLLTEALLELKGEKFVSKLLSKSVDFLVFCHLDSLGYLQNILRIIPPRDQMTDKTRKDLESYLVRNKIQFYICYLKPPELTEKQSKLQISEELSRQGQSLHLMNMAFPGDYMKGYDGKKTAPGSAKPLSRFDYMQDEMRKIKRIPVFRAR